jgi:hypothetical protein
MPRIIAALLCAVCVGCASQAPLVVSTQTLAPSPLGVVLIVGKWIFDSSTRQEVYYIEVAGDGPTIEQARNNGFRLAVEKAIGTLISSETEVQNGKIVRDEIISYASGYVDRFETISQQKTASGFRVSMRVWVKRSALADRLLSRSKQSGQIDGAIASVKLQTINEERATGDRLLQTVLNDFPRRAFDIKIEPTNINRQNRIAVLEVIFSLSWNQDYLRSLWAALDATSQRKGRAVASIWVSGGTFFSRWGGEAKFDDAHKLNLLVNRMIGSRPALLVVVRGTASETLFTSCYLLQELDHQPDYWVNNERFVRVGSNFAQIVSRYRYKGQLQISISPSVLARVTAVDMDIVNRNQCPEHQR